MSQIYFKKKRFEIFGSVNSKFLIKQDRPKSFTKNIEKAIADFMDEYFQIYMHEIVAFVWEEFDVFIDENIIRKALTRIRLTYKRVEIINGEQDKEL
jgi:transposase